jgi:hypothetical protein
MTYDYGSSDNLITDKGNYKIYTRPLFREESHKENKEIGLQRKEKKYLVMGPKGVSNTKTV